MTELDENSLELAARAAYDAAPLVFGSWDRPARGTESSVTTAPVSWDEVQQDAASGDRVCAGVVQDIHRSARAAILAFLSAEKAAGRAMMPWEVIESAASLNAERMRRIAELEKVIAYVGDITSAALARPASPSQVAFLSHYDVNRINQAVREAAHTGDAK